MTRQFDVDRTLESWLAEGPSQLAERVVDSIVRQLDKTPQRKYWWLLRRERVNRTTFALGGAAGAVVVAVLALGLYDNQLGFGQPTPSWNPMPTSTFIPTSTPTAPPTAIPSPTASASLPTLQMPGFGPSRAGWYGWTALVPGQHVATHYVVEPEGREATEIGFTVGPDCLVTTGNPEPRRVEIGDLEGVSIEPYEPGYLVGPGAEDEITRAYELEVGNTTLCVFLTWHPTSSEEEIARAEAAVQSLRAEPTGFRGVRIMFRLSHGWDTG